MRCVAMTLQCRSTRVCELSGNSHHSSFSMCLARACLAWYPMHALHRFTASCEPGYARLHATIDDHAVQENKVCELCGDSHHCSIPMCLARACEFCPGAQPWSAQCTPVIFLLLLLLWGVISIVNIIERIARKFRIIILLHF